MLNDSSGDRRKWTRGLPKLTAQGQPLNTSPEAFGQLRG